MKLAKNSLVLYKRAPACVAETADKLTIVLPDGKSKNVRDKDVVLLHPGPLPAGWQDIEKNAPTGNPEEAWELLQGESPSLEELAELVYGHFTPTTAWLAFKLLNRSPWFKGVPDEIIVVDPAAAAARIQADQEKTESDNRWNDFFDRFKKKQIDTEKDELFLRDMELLALGKCKGSRILKTLNKTQTPENAHRTMLEYNIKPDTWNPHPLRLGIDMDIPDYPVPKFPDDSDPPRLDLTAVDAFAIDDEGNTDPDDAIAWDGEQFWVHIADAAALYPLESPQDKDARARASSLYLPETTVPMLAPKVLDRLGLGLSEISNALSYAFRLNSNLEITDFSVHLTKVRVTRLSYADADKLMDQEPFSSMKRISDAFAARRNAAGAININMPDVKIRVDDSGEIRITPLPDLPSRQLVTEAMLMAGSRAAAFCRDRNIPIPYTIQDVDAIEKQDESSPASAAASSPKATGYVAEYKRRRGMKRSRTTLECGPHAGLGLETYTRVTSPMRRYPDLLASRQIRQYLLGANLESAESVLAGLAMFESRIGSLIQAERRSNLFWKLLWLKRQPAYRPEAWLLDRLEKQGIFLIPELALETRIPLNKDMAPGTRVILKLKKVDIAESTVLFLVDKVP